MKYRSKLEKVVAEALGKSWDYEPFMLEYTQVKGYLPDFGNNRVIVEVKGFFRPGDISKYKAVAKAASVQGYYFCMVFADPNKPVRKGAKLTMAQWAMKNEISWYGVGNIHELKHDYRRVTERAHKVSRETKREPRTKLSVATKRASPLRVSRKGAAPVLD